MMTKPVARSVPASASGADELVERVVTADVLAHEHDVAGQRRPGGAVNGAIEAVHGLALRQLGGGLEDGGGVGPDRLRHRLGDPHDVGDVLDPAQPAAGAALERAARHARIR